MPADRDSTTTAEPIKKRVQLSHVLIDVDFFDKPKIIALGEKLGQPAIHLLIRIYAAMSKATDAEIDVSCIEYLARIIGFKDLTDFLDYCLERGILCEGSHPSMLTNVRVIEDQEKLAKNREESRLRQEKMRDKRVTNALPTRLPDTVTDTEDLNNKEKEIAKQLSTITPEAWNAVKRWAAHRKKLCLSFDSMAAEALQMQYAGRSDALIRDINASITANSRNIFQAPLREEERIKIAATAKAEVLKPVEPQRPKPKPIAPLSEPIEPVKPETMAECRRKIQEITRLATPKVSM